MTNPNQILVAHVTVSDETLTVAADKISEALAALHGSPKAGMRIDAGIVFDAMTKAEFEALPEFKT